MPLESSLQKNDDFEKLKNSRVWGGEISSACGLGPYDFDQLVNKIKSRDIKKQVESDEKQKHGILCEPKMKKEFEAKIGDELELRKAEKCVPPYVSGLTESCVTYSDNFLYDKKSGALEAVVEYKAPYDKMYSDVPIQYIIQITYQMRCTDNFEGTGGCRYGIFYAQMFDKKTLEPNLPQEVMIKKVERSDDLIEWIEKMLRTFIFCYREKKVMDFETILKENPMPMPKIEDYDPELEQLDALLTPSTEELCFSDF